MLQTFEVILSAFEGISDKLSTIEHDHKIFVELVLPNTFLVELSLNQSLITL